MRTARVGAVELAYEIRGEGDPLLMIMGFAADRKMWVLQLPAFETRYRCIAFDNRGVGESSLPTEPFDLATMADDALAVLDAAGVERAHVLGISMGGAIAQHLALRAPARVRSLVLAATWSSRNPYLERVADLGLAVYDGLGDEAFVKACMLWLFSPRFLLEQAALASGIQSLLGDAVPKRDAIVAQLRALLEHDTRERLALLDIPTLVMAGRRDVLVPPELSDAIAAAVPNAEHVLFETAHAFNIEEADAFNATVLGFLARR